MNEKCSSEESADQSDEARELIDSFIIDTLELCL